MHPVKHLLILIWLINYGTSVESLKSYGNNIQTVNNVESLELAVYPAKIAESQTYLFLYHIKSSQ